MKKLKIIGFIFGLLGIVACSEDYAPKPIGYFRIACQERDYASLETAYPFIFDIPSNAFLIEKTDSLKTENWFDMYYPFYKARIYCTYAPILNQNELKKLIEDNHQFVYRHIVKAQSIEEEYFEYPKNDVFGVLYLLKGNTATPIQFFATDSTHHFFRASLYFESNSNQDSLAPVISYIHNDIQHIISTFKWKK